MLACRLCAGIRRLVFWRRFILVAFLLLQYAPSTYGESLACPPPTPPLTPCLLPLFKYPPCLLPCTTTVAAAVWRRRVFWVHHSISSNAGGLLRIRPATAAHQGTARQSGFLPMATASTNTSTTSYFSSPAPSSSPSSSNPLLSPPVPSPSQDHRTIKRVYACR
jgi:hypothetical protein